MTVPHPERVKQWGKVVSYAQTKAKGEGPLSLVEYEIPTPHASAVGKKVALVSDFHFRSTPQCRRLAEKAAEIIARERVDVLISGGDLAADAIDLKSLPELFRILTPAAPVRLGVVGNWERGKTWLPMSLWSSLHETNGFHFLCNQSWSNEAFFIYGVDDLGWGSPRLPHLKAATRTSIVVSHRPDTIVALDYAEFLSGYSLVLTAHTHGGQVRLPFVGPLYTSSRYGCSFDYGMFVHHKYHLPMIVTSGIGNMTFPFRWRCRREVVIIRFVNSQDF